LLGYGLIQCSKIITVFNRAKGHYNKILNNFNQPTFFIIPGPVTVDQSNIDLPTSRQYDMGMSIKSSVGTSDNHSSSGPSTSHSSCLYQTQYEINNIKDRFASHVGVISGTQPCIFNGIPTAMVSSAGIFQESGFKIKQSDRNINTLIFTPPNNVIPPQSATSTIEPYHDITKIYIPAVKFNPSILSNDNMSYNTEILTSKDLPSPSEYIPRSISNIGRSPNAEKWTLALSEETNSLLLKIHLH
jgi:hypothetical protein